MGQTNSERVSHAIEALPNTFRDDQLRQILDDLNEEDAGTGYNEVTRTGVFVDKIIVWKDSSKAQKRTETTFSRTGAFVDQIVKEFFSEDGASVVSAITAVITRSGNKQVVYVDVTVARI